jgi:hypothetical protein
VVGCDASRFHIFGTGSSIAQKRLPEEGNRPVIGEDTIIANDKGQDTGNDGFSREL